MRNLLTVIFLLTFLPGFTRSIHVNNSATGANNGTSWINAYQSLQLAMDMANAGDTVKVATGTYRPFGAAPGASFILKNGIILLAGYAPAIGDSTEASRNWVTHPVTLSADLGAGNIAETLITANLITLPTVIDGVFITKAEDFGIRIMNSTSLLISHTVFEENSGNAVSLESSTAVLFNCVWYGNSFGRVIYNTTNSNAQVYNSIINSNTAGEIEQSLIVNNNASITFVNCTVAANFGKVFYGNGTGTGTFRNSIIWENRLNGLSEENDILSNGQAFVISNSITQTYFDNSNNTVLANRHPRFVNIRNPKGSDNRFFTPDDGLQLSIPCSPALNSGNNSYVSGFPFDILRQPRVFNAGTVDLGAYERQNLPGSIMPVVYVKNTNNTGTNDGSSWQNAFKSLQEAILYCADTIKVAAGTYLSSNSFVDSIFYIENKKVFLGGYPASGNPGNNDRNPIQNPTILKGNYSGASTGVFFPLVKSYNNDSTTILDGFILTNDAASPGGSPNRHALIIDFESRLKVLNCRLDVSPLESLKSGGAWVTGGSRPIFERCSFSTYMDERGGIGLYTEDNSVLRAKHCLFLGQTASSFRSGAAVQLYNANAIIDSCVFWKNHVSAEGTMITTQNGNLVVSNSMFRSLNNNGRLVIFINSSGAVSNSVFRNIDNFGAPASVYNDNSNPTFSHCLFDSSKYNVENINRSAPVFNNCASVFGRFMKNKLSFPIVNNSTIVNTHAGNVIGGNISEDELVFNEDSSTLRANNTIFWSNRLAPGKTDIHNVEDFGNPTRNSVAILSNCLTQNFGTHGTNGNIVGLNPRFFQLSDIHGIDNIMFTADDGLRLATCSPAINAGSNSAGMLLPNDVIQQPRIFNGTVDIGAYELQQNPTTVKSFYVNSVANGSDNGLNWQNAYNDLQKAVCNSCADTIRVAAGEYKPAISDRDSSFFLDRGVTILGGYPSSGNPDDGVRAPFENLTVISGSINHPQDSLDNTRNLFVLIGTKDTITLDGLVLKNGHGGTGGLQINAAGGSGIYTYYNHTNIRNCQFINNHSTPFGGAIYIAPRSTCLIDRSIFFNNSSTNAGGAIWYEGSIMNIRNSVFEENHSFGQGGAIYLGGGAFDLHNSIFYKNYTQAPNANGNGGAIWAGAGTALSGTGTFFNCTFLQNRTTYDGTMAGGALYLNNHLGRFVKNCIFKGNMVGTSTTATGADIDWSNTVNTVQKTLLQAVRSFTQPNNILYGPANFVDSIKPKGPDNRWLTADDGMQLHFSSQAINFGDNAIVANTPYDILGDSRIINTTVDLGAYEYQNKPIANAGKDTTICVGSSAQIGKPGNPGHTYSWTSSPSGFISSGANPIVTPTVTTQYFLEVSNGTTIAKDTVVVTPAASITPSVIITTETPTICQGTEVLFTAVPVNQGASGTYQWKVNNTNVGTNSPMFTSTTLSNGDQVQVVITSSAGCANPTGANSNVITMNVNPTVVPSVTIATPTLNICAGEPVTFTATPINGGTLPYYTWNVGGVIVQRGINNILTTANIISPSTVTVTITSNASCANPITAVSNQLQINTSATVEPEVTISATSTSVCVGVPVTFTASPVHGGTSPSYQWKRNGLNVGTNSNTYTTSALNNGDNVFVVMSSNLGCASPSTAISDTIFMAVTGNVLPGISINGNTTVLSGQSTVISSTIVNGGSGPVYQWQDSITSWQNIAGATGTSINYTPTVNGSKIRCVMVSNAVCASPSTITSAPLTFVVNFPTGVNPTPANSIGLRLYPNPTQTLFIIDTLRTADRWETLDITSVDGKHRYYRQNIANKTMVTVDVKALPAGLYMIILNQRSGKKAYLKLVKQ